MTDTPEKPNPHPDITFDDDASEVNPKPAQPAPAFKAPVKPTAATPSPKPVATPPAKPAAVAPPKPAAKPVSITPTTPKAPPAKAAKPSVAVDYAKSEKISMPSLIIDGLAAAVTVAFTVLILQDVLPFLK